MQKSIVKRKLKNGQPVLIPKVCFTDPSIVEMLGLLGFDAIWICNEYRPINPSTLEGFVRAARAGGADTLIRIGSNSYDDIVRMLCMGATGLMVPHVGTPEQVRQVVSRAKFPPLGNRELEPIYADGDFGLTSLEEYIEQANDETFIVIQIEDVGALGRVEDMAAIKGIDVLFVGSADLALNMGIPGQVRDQKVLEAIRRVVRACRGRGIHCGAPACDPEHCKRLLDEGVRFLTDSSDWRTLVSGFRQVKETYGKLGLSFRQERSRLSPP